MLYEKDGRQREVLPKTESDEIRQLRRELRVAHEEREILKKAAAFFAQEANRSR
jgi:transposase-like protein